MTCNNKTERGFLRYTENSNRLEFSTNIILKSLFNNRISNRCESGFIADF